MDSGEANDGTTLPVTHSDPLLPVTQLGDHIESVESAPPSSLSSGDGSGVAITAPGELKSDSVNVAQVVVSGKSDSLVKALSSSQKLGAWAKPLPIQPSSVSTLQNLGSELVQDLSAWPSLSESHHLGTSKRSTRFPWAAKMNPQVRNLHRTTNPEYMEDETPKVVIPNHVFLKGLEHQKYEFVLGRFYRCSALPGGLIYAVMNRVWGRNCRIFTGKKVSESSYLFHIPDDASTRAWVLERGLWHLDDCLLFVAPWTPTASLQLPEISTIPMWVTLTNNLYSIFGIAPGVGKPMLLTHEPILDPTLMGEAKKIMVEVELHKHFAQKVSASDEMGNLGHKTSCCLLPAVSKESVINPPAEIISFSPHATSDILAPVAVSLETSKPLVETSSPQHPAFIFAASPTVVDPLELTCYQSAATRGTHDLSTRLSHILRRLLGLRMRPLVCIATLLGSLAVVKARSSPGNSTDSRVDALLSIMGEFGYNQLLAQSWIGNDPCDKWWGINCLDGQIRAITLLFMNLTGSISPRFADITSLYVIDLSNNLLTGTIPSELTKLELHNLDVSYNRLHGRVPHFKKLVPNTKGNPEIGRDGQHTLAWILSGGALSLAFLLGAGIHYFRAWKRNRSARASQPAQNEMVQQSQQNVALPPSQQNEIFESENNAFSVETLREATQDFSISIGRGGSGLVYQGKLKDGREIAVKKMIVTHGTDCSVFDAEVTVLSRVRHRNIVSLYGYCIHGEERLLVYELMAQGSLSKHLEKSYEALRLDWSCRLMVALDVARGLEYLHTLASESQIYIHRDVKSANVLLGKDLRAKIGDFGLVKATTEDREPINIKCVGTAGYMAPEYMEGKILSRKADVYSFGVILLELITGKKAYNDRDISLDDITSWFEKRKEAFWNSIEVDIETDHQTQQSVREVAELAGSCCATEAEKRPEMSQIVRVLSSLIEIRDRRNQASSSGS